MRTLRFYCPEINKNSILTDSQFRHVTKVLRLQQGDCIELIDGKGCLAKAVINKIEKNCARLLILDSKTSSPPEIKRVIIAPSIAKGERFDLLVAKCTELGTDAIYPVLYDRTVKQTIQPQRLEMIAIESAKQCHRLFLPKINAALHLPKAIEKIKTDFPNAKFIFGSLTKGAISIMDFNPPGESDCVAFIGPEGGMTDYEEKMLKEMNAQPVTLTDTVLRIETAAITTAAVLSILRNR